METLTLTTPQSVTGYKVNSLVLNWGGKVIVVNVTDGFGKNFEFYYTGDVAVTLMTSLNKANLSVSSLHKRILLQLVTDGFIPAGTVTGTPD